MMKKVYLFLVLIMLGMPGYEGRVFEGGECRLFTE